MTRFYECLECGRIYSPTRPEQRFCRIACARHYQNRLRANEPTAVEQLMSAIRTEFERLVKK